MDNFEIIKDIGNGSFGIVFQVKRKIDGKIYALKRVNLKNLNPKERMNSLNEIRFLASISHQNIISYKESFYEEKTGNLNLVLEYANDGDLHSKIFQQKNKKVYFKEKQIWSYFIQLVKGLKVLHDNNLMHRDLKTANIFLMKNGICKLGDLNVAKLYNGDLLNSKMGTPCYAAPEIWNHKTYTFKSDIWSLGIILYELCTFNLPFYGSDYKDTYKKLMKGYYTSIPNHYSHEINIIINMCLQFNPHNRPTCIQLLENDIIKKKIESVFGFSGVEIKNEVMNIPNHNMKSVKSSKDILKLLPKFSKYKSEHKKSFSINDKVIYNIGDERTSDNFREMDIHTYKKEDIKMVSEKKRKECLSGNINIDKKKKNYRMNSASNSFLSQVKITLFGKEDEKLKSNEKNKNNRIKNNFNIKSLYLRNVSSQFSSTENESLKDSNSSSNNSKLKSTPETNDSNNEDDNTKIQKSIFMKKVSLVNQKFNVEKLLSLNKENIKCNIKLKLE